MGAVVVESDDEDLGQMDAKVRETVGEWSMSCRGVKLATALGFFFFFFLRGLDRNGWEPET